MDSYNSRYWGAKTVHAAASETRSCPALRRPSDGYSVLLMLAYDRYLPAEIAETNPNQSGKIPTARGIRVRNRALTTASETRSRPAFRLASDGYSVLKMLAYDRYLSAEIAETNPNQSGKIPTARGIQVRKLCANNCC